MRSLEQPATPQQSQDSAEIAYRGGGKVANFDEFGVRDGTDVLRKEWDDTVHAKRDPQERRMVEED
jgi:hypothetical protein